MYMERMCLAIAVIVALPLAVLAADRQSIPSQPPATLASQLPPAPSTQDLAAAAANPDPRIRALLRRAVDLHQQVNPMNCSQAQPGMLCRK